MEKSHFGGEGGLVANRARHPTEEGGDFGTSLDESEDVVDEDEDVGSDFIAEIFGHSHGGESDAESGSGGLIHLSEDHGGFVDDSLGGTVNVGEGGFLHFSPEVVSFAGALADSGEHGDTGCFNGDVPDEFLDENGFAETSTTEETDFSTFVKGDEEVNNFESGLEEFDFNVLLAEFGRCSVDGVGWSTGDLFASVNGLTEEVENASEALFADGDLDGLTSILSTHSTDESVGGAEGDCSDHVIAEVLGDF